MNLSDLIIEKREEELTATDRVVRHILKGFSLGAQITHGGTGAYYQQQSELRLQRSFAWLGLEDPELQDLNHTLGAALINLNSLPPLSKIPALSRFMAMAATVEEVRSNNLLERHLGVVMIGHTFYPVILNLFGEGMAQLLMISPADGLYVQDITPFGSRPMLIEHSQIPATASRLEIDALAAMTELAEQITPASVENGAIQLYKPVI